MDLARFGANLRKLLALHELTGAQAAKVLGTNAAGRQRVAAGSSPAKQQSAVRDRPGVQHRPDSAGERGHTTLLPMFGDQDRYAETQARLKKQLRSLKAVR